MIDLRELRHFLAVADCLHFGRAAEQLGITQPPLSQSIQALERKLGEALFARSKRSVELTSFAQQWLLHVRPAVEAIEALPDTAKRISSGLVGKLSLAFVSTADYSLLPDLVQQFSTSFPDVELQLIEATNDWQIKALIDGRIDAGILIAPKSTLPPDLSYQPLLSEPLIAAIPAQWANSEHLDVQSGKLLGTDWMREPLLIFPQHVSPDFHDIVMSYYHVQGYQPQIRQEAIQMQTLISLVSAGLGMALVPQTLRNLGRPNVAYVDLEIGAPDLETGIAWRDTNRNETLANLLSLSATSTR